MKTVFCEDCGEPIPERRLVAVPHTRHCVQCVEVEVKRDIHLAGSNALIHHTENSNWRGSKD